MMKIPLRSDTSTQGRRMAGARALWRANGMKENQIGKPVIAVVNSFTQFVPGHTHLHEIGQLVKKEIEAAGCFAAEFNIPTINQTIQNAIYLILSCGGFAVNRFTHTCVLFFGKTKRF